MDWGGFPLGLRFKVADYSLETKAACWKEVLRVLSTACWEDISLYEVEISEPFPPYSKLYIAVIEQLTVPISRLNTPPFREDARVMGLCHLYMPLIQENYLELNAQERFLAKLEKDGSLRFDDEHPPFLPAGIERKPSCKKEGRMLVWAETEEELRARCFELAEQEPHMGVRRILLTRQEDAVPAIVSCREGLLLSITVSGQPCRCGILPGNSLLLALRDCPGGEKGIEALLPLALTQGFTKAVLLTEGKGYQGRVPAGMNLRVDPALKELYRIERWLRECSGVYRKESLPHWAY